MIEFAGKPDLTSPSPRSRLLFMYNKMYALFSICMAFVTNIENTMLVGHPQRQLILVAKHDQKRTLPGLLKIEEGSPCFDKSTKQLLLNGRKLSIWVHGNLLCAASCVSRLLDDPPAATASFRFSALRRN